MVLRPVLVCSAFGALASISQVVAGSHALHFTRLPVRMIDEFSCLFVSFFLSLTKESLAPPTHKLIITTSIFQREREREIYLYI